MIDPDQFFDRDRDSKKIIGIRFWSGALLKSFLFELVEIMSMTPSLPQRGRQPKGACPRDPHF